jgi:Nucleotide modification associated domain 2
MKRKIVMAKIYSYILRIDDGAAPNPFWGICTLTICKPAIRRKANIGDWIVGTGSKNSRCNNGRIYDLSQSLVYAMKVSSKMELAEYDKYCRLNINNKIPKWYSKDWRLRMGDCIYDFTNEHSPTIRKSVHNELNKERDLSGGFALLSDHFYYFGEKAIPIIYKLKEIIKYNQGHKIIERSDIVEQFEKWINNFKRNKIYADPQLRHEFDFFKKNQISKCALRELEDFLEEDKIKTIKNKG